MKRDKPKRRLQKKARLIPEGELKCVWMIAGVVSFKLCNSQYDCENCPFDRVMKKNTDLHPQDKAISDDTNFQTFSIDNLFSEDKTNQMPHLDFEKIFPQFFNIRIKQNLLYHYGHTWVEMEAPNCVKIGIDDFIRKFILGIKMVILPSRKNKITEGQVCCWIVEADGTLPILAPLSGSVLSLNPQVLEQPTSVMQSPYEKGWLMKIQPSRLHPEQKNLYMAEKVPILYKKDIQKLKVIFESRLTSNQIELGPTMCDGGDVLNHLRDMIGRERYFEIISHFFTSK